MQKKAGLSPSIELLLRDKVLVTAYVMVNVLYGIFHFYSLSSVTAFLLALYKSLLSSITPNINKHLS